VCKIDDFTPEAPPKASSGAASAAIFGEQPSTILNKTAARKPAPIQALFCFVEADFGYSELPPNPPHPPKKLTPFPPRPLHRHQTAQCRRVCSAVFGQIGHFVHVTHPGHPALHC